MKLRTLFWLSVITGCLLGPIAQGQTFSFDGYKTSADSYARRQQKGCLLLQRARGRKHTAQPKTQSIKRMCAGASARIAQKHRQAEYFFLYVETPIEVKNMIWADAVTDQDVLDYNVHYTNSPRRPRKRPI